MAEKPGKHVDSMCVAELKDSSEMHFRTRTANGVLTFVLERTEGRMGRINCCIIIEIVTSICTVLCTFEKEIKVSTGYQGKTSMEVSTDNTNAAW